MITKEGLNAVRDEFHNDLLKKIRINGTVIIEEFEVSNIGDGYVEISFGIPDELTTISGLEILDSTNRVIASNNFYVIVVPNTFFKYRITFKGGN